MEQIDARKERKAWRKMAIESKRSSERRGEKDRNRKRR
jgi:hypothetical protein